MVLRYLVKFLIDNLVRITGIMVVFIERNFIFRYLYYIFFLYFVENFCIKLVYM